MTTIFPPVTFAPEPDHLADAILAYIECASYRTTAEIAFKFNEPDPQPVLDRLMVAGKIRPRYVPDAGNDGHRVTGWEVCR